MGLLRPGPVHAQEGTVGKSVGPDGSSGAEPKASIYERGTAVVGGKKVPVVRSPSGNVYRDGGDGTPASGKSLPHKAASTFEADQGDAGASTPAATPEAAEEALPDPKKALKDAPVTVKGSDAYKKAYLRGWRTSQKGSQNSALDNADGRGEPGAWYDGYHDYADSRPKWTLMNFDSAEAYEASLAGGEFDDTPNYPEGFEPVSAEQAEKDQQYLWRIEDLPNPDEDSPQGRMFPVNFSLAVEDANTNALDHAVDLGFATKQSDGTGRTEYLPVGGIGEIDFERWVNREAAVGVAGILDGYGYDPEGNLYDFNVSLLEAAEDDEAD